ncbi:hypothetical protein ACSQ67_020715 [Phaseolus vulgaris]
MIGVSVLLDEYDNDEHSRLFKKKDEENGKEDEPTLFKSAISEINYEFGNTWPKETTQSCSTIAILVATLVFVRRIHHSGGTVNGTPVFLHSSVFLFFTIMDVVALATSLASSSSSFPSSLPHASYGIFTRLSLEIEFVIYFVVLFIDDNNACIHCNHVTHHSM